MVETGHNSFYNSDEWNLLRKYVIEHNPGCIECGRKDRLTVHHKHYRNFGGNETLDDLEVLCLPCHQTVHKTDEDYWKSIVERIYKLEKAIKEKEEPIDFKAFSFPTPPKPLKKQVDELYQTLADMRNNQGRDFVIIHNCFLCPYSKEVGESLYKCLKYGKLGCYPGQTSSWND